ncbi:MAG: transglutaminase-like domain-containing protein [Candidatus Woesearchaeota archaeon]
MEDLPELHEEKEPWYKGPIKVIMGLFMLLLIVLWVVPHYGIKQNPEPSYTPTIIELNVRIAEIPKINSSDIRDYVQVTPEIKQLADKIITLSCPETNRVCNAKALFYFVRDNFNYVNDPTKFEYYKTPQESLTSDAGDCDDSSILTSSLLQAVGFQTRFVFVPGHVYLQAKIPEALSTYKTEQDWINLDPTCKNCKFGEIHYSYADSRKNVLE